METLDNSAIYRHKKLLGTIYQNKLARQVVSDKNHGSQAPSFRNLSDMITS
jgi:hypothetical protein